MHKIMLLLTLFALFAFVSLGGTGAAATKDTGESLFKKHCSACHRRTSRLKSVKNIVATIRNPPAYMPSFNEDKISDNEAKKVADYIYQRPD